MQPLRVAITGAAGQIGYVLTHLLAAGPRFVGRPFELRLLELPQAMPALEGVAMELSDCAFANLAGIEIGHDPRHIFDGANVALLVGAAPRKAGMERSALLAANGQIFAAQGRILAEVADADLRVVVTGNPANTNAYITMSNAREVPAERFTALTRLDHNRAISLLAKKAGCHSSHITRMSIWGNHSLTQYPDVYNARIRGLPAATWLADDAWVNFDFIPQVARRGAAVIAARGRSSAASAAAATIAHLRDWLTGTAPDDWTSMAVVSDGSYAVPAGLVSSFPVTTAQGDWRIVPDLPLNALARARIATSIQELQAEAEMVRSLGLVS